MPAEESLVRIDFGTNAETVRRQIRDLNRQVQLMESNIQKLGTSLDRGKASSRALTGDIRGKTTILKLDKQIAAVAEGRVRSATVGYDFVTPQQKTYIQGLMKTNEVMRIQRKIMDDNATAMVNLGKNTQWAGRQLVVGFTVPLTIAAGAAAKAFSDLEKEMLRFKRVYGDTFTSTDEVTRMANEVKKLATEWTKYGVAVSDTAQIAADAAGAGFKGDQLLAQINSATKIAVLGELDKQKAMKATIALQSTFHMSNKELSHSINYLNQLENQTMVTMDDMATAIPKAATVVQGLGGSIRDLGTFMAAMAEGGVSAAEGANALKSGLGSLLNPSKRAREQLANIGITMDDLWAKSEKNGGGVLYVVEQLSSAMEHLGQTQKQMVIEELFGKHQFARMNALLSNINKGTQALQAKGAAGTGQLESAMIAQRELGKLGESSLTKFQASIQSLKSQIAPVGEQVLKAITPFVNGASKALEWFNKLPDIFKNAGLVMVAGIGIVTPVVLMLVGQIQNLAGNAMKLVIRLRNIGKNTKWIAHENLTLADSITKVDMQLIAENQLLSQNASLWQARQAAATGGAPPPKRSRKRSRLGFSMGGVVPGVGNRDTIPAMLTPGESVINKKASAKFGPILEAINSGKFRMFARGGVRIDRGAPKSVRAMVKDAFFSSEALEAAAHKMANVFGLDVAKILPEALSRHDRNPVAAHRRGTIDPATGRKIYPTGQIISDMSVVNNLMEQSSPEKSAKNFKGLEKAAQGLIQELIDSGASAEKVQKAEARYKRVLDQLAEGKHLALKSDRKTLASLGVRAVADGGMSSNYEKMLHSSLPALGLGVRNASGEVITRTVQREMDAAWEEGAASGKWVGTRDPKKKWDKGEIPYTEPNNRRFDPMSIMFAMSMFGTEISSVTDRLGVFGTALTTALTIFSMANMFGVSTPMGGGFKGLLGRGAIGSRVGVAARYAKFGGFAGGVGGLLGGAVGGAIGDKVGGSVGSAIKWGATGAGLGMAFGPLGAAIGGAVGALAGFAVQVLANSKAQKEAVEAMEGASAAYQNIGNQLSEKYQLGGNVSLGSYISGAASMNDKQSELYEQLKADMMASDGDWNKRIEDLISAQSRGLYGGARNELDSLTMQLRGQGVDEESIKIVVKAFAESMPSILRGSLIPSAVNPMSTESILGGIDTRKTISAGSLLTTTLLSLNTQLLNLDKNSKTYESDQAKLNVQIAKAKDLLSKTQSTSSPKQFKRIVGAGVVNLIKDDQGKGLSEKEWRGIQDGFRGNQVELSFAAQALIVAGYDLSSMAGAQVMALQGALKGMADQQGIIDEQTAIGSKAKQDLQALANAKASRDSALAANKGGDLESRGKALDIQGAKLEISQLNIEASALAKFKSQFNKAFGTSIDSFADAQFHIDKIANKIERINVKIIAPLQEKVNDLNRLNELAQRRMDKLEEAKQKRIDSINESYDAQEKALERIRQQNEFIANQQKSNITLADSLSKGDLAGAAGAMVQSAQNQAQYSATLSDQKLADSRDAAITNAPETYKIDKLKAAIAARSEEIFKLEDRIYSITEKQIEPLQRRSELMNLMLSTSKMIAENQKANANGLDAENFARTQALQSAKESLFEAKNRLTEEDKILQSYKNQRKAIIDANKSQIQGSETIEQTLGRMIKTSDTAVTTAKDKLKVLSEAASAFSTGMKEGADYLEKKAKPNTNAHAILAAVLNVDPKAYRDTGGAIPSSKAQPRIGPYGYPIGRSMGGTVGGRGGQDSVAALLTPGEFVMRKSAVDRIGVQNLRRANQGAYPDTNSNSVGKYAKGGLVKANFLGVFGDKVLEEFASALPGSPSSGKGPEIGSRGADNAVNYLLSRLGKGSLPLVGVNSVLNRCLTLVGALYSRFVGAKSAPSANSPISRIAGMKRSGIQFYGGYNAPKGAMYWYGGGANGHVGFADGKGNVVGNYGGNFIEKRDAHLGGRSYYGWTTKMANGGLVPGSSNYDSVRAALTPGEFVVNRSAVKSIGTAPLRALNEGKVLGATPSKVHYPDVNGDGGTVVYNNYDLAFTIHDASDAYEVANVIVRQFERASKSKVRKR